MGKVIPDEPYDGIGKHLRVVAPDRTAELNDAIGSRAAELVEQDRDLAVDGPAKGMLAMSAVILAAYENLLPEFDGGKRRTVLSLQHVFDEAPRHTMAVVVETLASGVALSASARRAKPLALSLMV